MIRFSFFGIPVEIQPWFWISLAVIGGALGADDANAMLRTALFVLAGALSIFIHELGHALTGRAFGAPTAIILYAFGGLATFPSGIFTRTQDFLVSAAGPAVQLVLAAAAWLVLRLVPLPTAGAFWLVLSLYHVSLYWALLNLIPVIPLDGGHMLQSLLGPRQLRLALRISTIAAIAAAILLYLNSPSIIFPILLLSFAWQNHQMRSRIR